MTTAAAPTRGQWANAPLVFVLAQVRFLPQTGVTAETIRDAISKRLVDRFKTINPTSTLDIQINLGEGPKFASNLMPSGYDLLNAEINAMVRIHNNALTYATTSYQDSTVFLAQWTAILEALTDVGIGTVNRLGMRYVDFVIPTKDKAPEDYVVVPWDFRGMKQLPGSDGLPEMNVSMMDIPYPEGRLRIQFMRGIGSPSLPADLQGMLPPVKHKDTPEAGLCAIIDTDRWMDGNHSADTATLREKFSTMRNDLSNAFRSMITQAAYDEWTKQEAKGDAT